MEFILTEGSTADFNLTENGVYTVAADRDKIGIDLTVNLSDDGTLQINGISGVKGNADNTLNSQQTGDTPCSILGSDFAFIHCRITFNFCFEKKGKIK